MEASPKQRRQAGRVAAFRSFVSPSYFGRVTSDRGFVGLGFLKERIRESGKILTSKME